MRLVEFLTQKLGPELIKQKVVELPKIPKQIDKTSNRYKILKQMYGDNEELITKMY